MKTIYLRLYKAFGTSEEAVRMTNILNTAVNACATELKSQGMNVQLLEVNSGISFEYDKNCVPMYRSSLYRWYFDKKIKFNKVLYKINNFYYKIKIGSKNYYKKHLKQMNYNKEHELLCKEVEFVLTEICIKLMSKKINGIKFRYDSRHDIIKIDHDALSIYLSTSHISVLKNGEESHTLSYDNVETEVNTIRKYFNLEPLPKYE